MSIEYTVYCDDCGSIMAASGKNAGEARQEAASAWQAVNRGKQDFCGSCNERRIGNARFDRRIANNQSSSTTQHGDKG